jgi:thiamine transport system ATP-binding protein
MSIELRAVSVDIDGIPIITDVDLDAADRERVAIMGPSGAGKSTLLRAIAGLIPVASGQVLVDGEDHTTTPAHRRGVGLMFQDFALFPHLDVAGNVGYGLRMAGVDADTRHSRVSESLAMVGLTNHADRAIDALSGGERQRVALARTLAPRPRVILLDEPLGSLDQALKEDLLAEMRDIVDGLGVTAVYVTHDRFEAEAFAHRIAIMRGGRLLAIDEPEALWRAPRSEFIARFMGHRTVVDGEIVDRPGRVVLLETAIRPDPDGRIEGVVAACDFRDGRYRTVVRVADQSIGLWTDTPSNVGDMLRISVDDAGIVELVDEVGRADDASESGLDVE